jgi:hypothetical protein
MGEIVFENDPPYKRLNAQSAQAIPTSDGVELVLSVSIEGPTAATVPVRILITPEVANALARQIEPAAGAAGPCRILQVTLPTISHPSSARTPSDDSFVPFLRHPTSGLRACHFPRLWSRPELF